MTVPYIDTVGGLISITHFIFNEFLIVRQNHNDTKKNPK